MNRHWSVITKFHFYFYFYFFAATINFKCEKSLSVFVFPSLSDSHTDTPTHIHTHTHIYTHIPTHKEFFLSCVMSLPCSSRLVLFIIPPLTSPPPLFSQTLPACPPCTDLIRPLLGNKDCSRHLFSGEIKTQSGKTEDEKEEKEVYEVELDQFDQWESHENETGRCIARKALYKLFGRFDQT